MIFLDKLEPMSTSLYVAVQVSTRSHAVLCEGVYGVDLRQRKRFQNSAHLGELKKRWLNNFGLYRFRLEGGRLAMHWHQSDGVADSLSTMHHRKSFPHAPLTVTIPSLSHTSASRPVGGSSIDAISNGRSTTNLHDAAHESDPLAQQRRSCT